MFYRSIHGNIMNITLLLSLTFHAPFFSYGKKMGASGWLFSRFIVAEQKLKGVYLNCRRQL